MYYTQIERGRGTFYTYFCADEKNQIQTKQIGEKSKGIVTFWNYSEIILKGILHHSETKKFW